MKILYLAPHRVVLEAENERDRNLLPFVELAAGAWLTELEKEAQEKERGKETK